MELVRMERKPKEEKAIVLDFLPHGYPFDDQPGHKKTPIVQAIGHDHFVLLELVPKKEATNFQTNEEIYIGEGKREKIHHILGKLPMEKLTATGNAELSVILEEMVKKNEARFVAFFNEAHPLTTRMHQLQLLPGLGKKHMWEILEERRDKPFESFDDIKKRVKLMPDPEKIIVKRILKEIEGSEKHRLFVDV